MFVPQVARPHRWNWIDSTVIRTTSISNKPSAPRKPSLIQLVAAYLRNSGIKHKIVSNRAPFFQYLLPNITCNKTQAWLTNLAAVGYIPPPNSIRNEGLLHLCNDAAYLFNWGGTRVIQLNHPPQKYLQVPGMKSKLEFHPPEQITELNVYSGAYRNPPKATQTPVWFNRFFDELTLDFGGAVESNEPRACFKLTCTWVDAAENILQLCLKLFRCTENGMAAEKNEEKVTIAHANPQNGGLIVATVKHLLDKLCNRVLEKEIGAS